MVCILGDISVPLFWSIVYFDVSACVILVFINNLFVESYFGSECTRGLLGYSLPRRKKQREEEAEKAKMKEALRELQEEVEPEDAVFFRQVILAVFV